MLSTCVIKSYIIISLDRRNEIYVYMGLDSRKLDFIVCKQQRCRSACTSVQSDHCLFSFLRSIIATWEISVF